jgi:serine O-acetyltransferase
MNLLILIFSSIRLIPHVFTLFVLRRNRDISADISRWADILMKGKPDALFYRFLFLMSFYPEFRNLFYYRVGDFSIILNIFCRRMDTLFLAAQSIGPGLFIQHGFATIIAAKRIGAHCWINQQVTVGYSNETDCPIIGDNVTICAGAKVIGAVVVGENSKIGANAVVVKTVPPNVTVVGVPARIVRRNGSREEAVLSR